MLQNNMPLQQLKEQVMKEFRKLIYEPEHTKDACWCSPVYSKEADGNLHITHHEQRDVLTDFLMNTLTQAIEEVDKLIEKHKNQACQIANVAEYDEVNMVRFVENPLIRSLVSQHIDTIRELSTLKDKE